MSEQSVDIKINESEHEFQEEENGIFLVEEIDLEEMAIDGICGVY